MRRRLIQFVLPLVFAVVPVLAAVLIAALTGIEPVAVVGRGTGIDDRAWMRKTAAIRDALRRARKVIDDPEALLRTSGGADIAALAGFLAQAAVRRTPVLLDGVVVGAIGVSTGTPGQDEEVARAGVEAVLRWKGRREGAKL